MPMQAGGHTRRGFLGDARRAAALGATFLLAERAASVASPDEADEGGGDILVIDAHAHPYSPDLARYPPGPKPYAPPMGAGTVERLRQDTRENGVRWAVAVQPRTFYLYDNSFVVDTGRSNREWLTSVCNLDPDDPASPDLLVSYARQANVRGLVSVTGRRGRFQDDIILSLWERAERLGIVINVNIGRASAEELDTMLGRFPDARVALDHAMNLRVGSELEPTLQALSFLSRRPNVHAKLSFIPTGTRESYPFRDIHEACRRVIQMFGADRCAWGSNFPCELWCPNVSYSQHLRLFTHELGLDRPTKEAILGKTARRLWFADRS